MVYYLQTSIFSLMIITLVYLNIRKNPNKFRLDHRIFILLLLVTAAATALDLGMILIDGHPGTPARIGNLVITSLYYISNPLPCLIWAFYAELLIFKDSSRLKKLVLPLVIPVMINTFLSVASIFTHSLFYIDSHNIYHRGSWFYLMAAICYFYLVYTFIQILRNHSIISTKDLGPMLFFAIPPTIGGILQVLFFGTSILWVSVSFSALIIYTNLQNATLSTDHLTGLSNRRQLDVYLQHLNHSLNTDIRIAGMMIDLNDLKVINDRFGHKMGDAALEQTALILRNSLRKDDFISRYGGDEFAVIFTVQNMTVLENTIHRIYENIAGFNACTTYPFTLSFSIGYDLYDNMTDKHLDDFMKRLDDKMYADKQEYHHAKCREAIDN